MKRTIIVLALLAAVSSLAQAPVDTFSKTFSLITTNSSSGSQVIRGNIEAVYVDVAATKTNTILVSDSLGTIFSESVSSDALKPIAIPLYGTTGSALTFVGGTNNTANAWYTKRVAAGEVTIRAAGAADTTGTNSVTVTVIYSQP